MPNRTHRGLTLCWAPILPVVAAVLLAAAGCGGGRGAEDSVPLLRVTERDFHISAPKRVPSGDLRLSVLNKGPDAHELILIRAPHPGLPVHPDDITVDEEQLEGVKAIVGVLEAGAPRSLRRLDLHLAPGRYEFICNMAGHYMAGMRAVMVVE